MWTRRIALTALLVAVPATLAQRNIYVDGVNGNDAWDGRCRVWNGQTCGPKKTIQAGIDAAMPGDTILIADSIYSGSGNYNVDLRGKKLTIRGESGAADRCVIDPQFAGRGFYLHSGETAEFTDLTIQHGLVVKDSPGYAAGAGIYCSGGTLTVRRCVLTENEARDYNGAGAAIHVRYGTLNMQDCTVQDNDSGGSNAGVYAHGAAAVIQACRFEGNRAETSFGGAALTGYTEPTPTLVQRCTFRGNMTARGAGAVHFWRLGVIEDCLFEDNAGTCGAVEVDGTSSMIRRCVFRGNYAYTGAGAISARALTLENSVIAGNRDAGWDGTVYGSPMSIVNCTIVGNDGANGAAVNPGPNGAVTLANCIVYGNQPAAFKGSVVATYCNVQGGWPGEGNIDADPRLAFEADAHLTAESPCIDRGTNSPPGGLPATDLDGNPRVLPPGGVADMGAYEFNPASPTIAVSGRDIAFSVPVGGQAPAPQTAAVRNAGGSTLRWRIEGDCPWLAVTPRSGESTGEIDPVTIRVDPAGLPHGQHLCALRVEDPGAINSPIPVSVILRMTATLDVPQAYPTIQAAIDAAVDGDVVRLADGTYAGPGNWDVSFRGKALTVTSSAGTPETCVVDCGGTHAGFAINRREPRAATLAALTIRNAGTYRGVALLIGRGSDPTIVNCRIIENASGGAWIENYARPQFRRCLIASNSGSGVVVWGATPTFSHCVFRDNQSEDGGALHAQTTETQLIRLNDCWIYGNRAQRGGGISGDEHGPMLDLFNCCVFGNSATYYGGGIVVAAMNTFTLRNSIIWGNSAGLQGPQLALLRGFRGGGVADVAFCNLRGGPEQVYVEWGMRLIWGPGNRDADPLFVDPAIGDLHLKPGSPCIDTGDPTFQPPPGATDIDRQKRVWDGDRNGIAVVDIGADEFGSFVYGDLNCDGVINNFDIDPFVLALTDPAGYGQKFPDCDRLLADTNGDGKVDNFDIDPFVKLLSGS